MPNAIYCFMYIISECIEYGSEQLRISKNSVSDYNAVSQINSEVDKII